MISKNEVLQKPDEPPMLHRKGITAKQSAITEKPGISLWEGVMFYP